MLYQHDQSCTLILVYCFQLYLDSSIQKYTQKTDATKFQIKEFPACLSRSRHVRRQQCQILLKLCWKYEFLSKYNSGFKNSKCLTFK